MNITLLKTFVRKMFATNFVAKAIISVVLLIAVSIQVASFILPQTHQAQAAINLQINYQGKLTNTSDVAVANGDYNMEFILYDAPSGGSTLWTETRTGANKVTVTNGLFSVMLGSVTALTSVDFNQTVYLGVNIGGTGSPSWDGEMTPRKTIGSVPSAFLANGVVGTGGVRNTIDSATALTIAKAGSNYALQVDTSAGSAATGLKVTSNAASSGLALAVISSGTDESLTLNAKGAGSITIGTAAGSTGDIIFGGGSGTTGCTVTNSTGAFACSAGLTGVGVNASTGLLQGSLGLTVTGAAVSLNDSSNFAVNIATGTNNALTTIGGGSGTFSLQTTNIDISNTGAITGATGFNGLVITANTGVITTGTWNGTAVTDTYVADTLTVDSSSSVHWNALNNYPAACSAGSAISQLADTTNTCTAFNTDTSITLQDAYGAGNSIETASNTSVVVTETTTGAVTGDLLQLTVNQATGGTYSGDALQITMDGFDANAYTGNGINIIVDQSQNTGSPILVQDDAAVTLFQLNENGAITLGAASAETTAITITDTDYTNALSIGDNNITGTTYTVTGTTATIDFTNFDVSSAGALVAVGVNSGSGLLQGTGGLTLTGTTNINATGTAATNIGNSTGVLTLASGGASGWTNTSGNLTIQTATSGTMTIDSAGALNLGTTNSTSTTLGKAGTTLTVNPTSWTATPTISGLITATSGLTSNGTLTVSGGQNLTMASGSGVFAQTSTLTTTSPQTLSATALTTGVAQAITLGSALTTGGAYSVASASYNHGAAEIGSLSSLAFSDVTSGAFASTTNGILVSPTVNITAGAATKTINGVSVNPTFTACTTATCNVQGVNIANVTDSGNFTSSAIKVGTGWDTILSGTTAGTNLIDFTNFKVTSAGVASALTGLSSSGTIQFSSLTTNGALYTSSGNGTLTTTAPTSGALGYWSRSTTILDTATAGDLIRGTGGLTITGAAVSLNASSNFAVDIATGTSTGTITLGGTGASQSIQIGTGVAAKTIAIGNSTDDTFSINSSAFTVSTAGAVSGVTGYIQGSGTMSLTSANTTQTTTSSVMAVNASSLTSGTGIYAAAGNSLTSGKLVDLQVSSTGSLTGQTALNIATAGTNGTGGQTTYGIQVANTHTGTSTNVAGYFTASGGSSNYGLVVPAGTVGIGTATPNGANGILQVSGDIGMTGNTYIRQSTNSDGNTLTILATQVVAANSNANGYGYSGGGLLASNSPSASALLLDVGATTAGTAHRLKVTNDGSGVTGTLFYGTPTLTTLYADSATSKVGVGTSSLTGNLTITQTATATGALKGIVYTGAVNTNQTLSTEIPSLTVTTAGRQWATGALTTQREVLITQPTYSFVGASTITDAATVGIAGAPIKSTNASITNTHALLIQGGAVSTATNSYGLTVNAQTGATNNYAAAFLGGNVGIGTATPGAKLDVSGDLFVNSGNSGYTRIYTDINNVPNITTSSNALVLASGGTRNVVLNGTSLWLAGADINYISGSGTVLSVTSSSAGIGILVPKTNLHVVSSGATTGLGSTPADRGLAISGVGGQDRIYMESTNATSGQRVFNIDNTSGVLSINSLNDAASAFVNQNIFNVRYDGYIGIGTSTPGTTLGIQSSVSSDNLRLGDINGGYYYKIGRNTSTGALDFTGTQTSYRGFVFNNPDDNFAVVNSGGTNRILSMTSTAAAVAGIKLYNSSRNYSWFLDNRGSLDSPNDRFGLFNNAGAEVITALTGGNIGVGDNTPNSLFTVGSGDLFQVNTSGDVFGEFTTLNGSTTANGAGTASNTLILTSATNFDVGNYVKVSSTSCAPSVNVCYAKITAISTNTLTISPALTWANASSVVEMHIPEIGGTNTASTLTNRYGRGYFIDGVVTGNGSTYFSDRSINLTSGNLALTGGNLGVPLGGSGTPSIFFNGDSDTGFYSPTANKFAITTAGNDRVVVDNVGIVTINGNTSGGNALVVGTGVSQDNIAITNGALCVDYNSNSCSGLTPGTVYANDSAISRIDVAENYPSKDSTLQPGEVVVIDEFNKEYIKRSNIGAGRQAIGVISTAPGITLGGRQNKYAPDKVFPLALVGRVPVKVTNENGAILPGDFLTVSATIPGYAMKAITAGPILGQALEGFNQASGSIMTFIKPTDFNGIAIEKQMAGLDFNYSISSTRISQSSEAILDRLISQLANLDESNLSEVNTDLVIAGAEVISPNVTAGALRANTFASAASDGGIEVQSATVFKGGLQVDSIGSLGGLLTFQSDVEFIGTPYLNKDTAGFAVIKPGAVSVDVIFGNSYLVQPIVGASISFEQSSDLALVTDPAAQELLKQQAITDAQAFMGEGVSYVITNKTSKGFTIVLNKTASKELRFSWTAFAVKNANVFTSIDPTTPSQSTPPDDSAIIPDDTGTVAGDSTTP